MRVYNSDITVEEFIARHAKLYDPATDNYFREPFAQDTKVGKNSAIYNAHSFHTKVPPEGIVPYILHYTEPGDLVLDPFAGSGMTGVAAIITGRRAILNDLSPAACHIAYNYCTPCDVEALKREFARIVAELQEEFDWLYGTTHDDGTPATIQYTIWSDVFRCCRCGERFILWDVAVDQGSGKVAEQFNCPHCGFQGAKTKHTRVDAVPVVTNYAYIDPTTGKKKRAEHRTTQTELAKIWEIEAKEIPYWYPTDPFGPDREMWRGGHRDAGITRVCDFYTKRNLWALAALWNHGEQLPARLRYAFRLISTATSNLVSRMRRFRQGSAGGNLVTGTLYVPSFNLDANVPKVLYRKASEVFDALQTLSRYSCNETIVGKGDAAGLRLCPNCIDYIFTDPPFGCLAPEALILTEKGYKPISQVQVGERVLSHLGRWNCVQATSERSYHGLLIELQVAFFSQALRLTPNHLVLAIRTHPCDYDLSFCRAACSHLKQRNYHCGHYYRQYQAEWIPAGELRPYDLILMPTLQEHQQPDSLRLSDCLLQASYTLEGETLYYEKVSTETLGIRTALATHPPQRKGDLRNLALAHSFSPSKVYRIWNTEVRRGRQLRHQQCNTVYLNTDLARLIGYFLAEGSTEAAADGGTINFHFHVKETDYHQDVTELMARVFGLTARQPVVIGNSYRLCFYSKPVAHFLRHHCGHNALVKRVPNWLLTASPALQAELVKGFWRGDGSHGRRNFQLTTVSPALAGQLRLILQRLNVVARTYYTSSGHDFEIDGKRRHGGPHFALFAGHAWLDTMAAVLDETHMHQAQRQRLSGTMAVPHDMGVFLPIRDVCQIEYEGPVYDLQTADHSFTTAWGCVHNSNIFYADCSLLWEAWLQDFTDVQQEAVWNKSLKPAQGGKTLADYSVIMDRAFAEMYRVLKPGRWASIVDISRHYREQFSAIEIERVRATKAVFPIMSSLFQLGRPCLAGNSR